jgi:hypothetical protein
VACTRESLEEMPERGEAWLGSEYEVAVFGEHLEKIWADGAGRERVGYVGRDTSNS